jgi:acylphosphatase
MCREAVKHKVKGWVRNRRDGSVEALLQGEPESVALLIEWARKGPPGACVERIEIAEGTGHFADFSAYPTL